MRFELTEKEINELIGLLSTLGYEEYDDSWKNLRRIRNKLEKQLLE